MSKAIDRKSLAEKFERHAREEEKILSQYGVLAEQLGDSEAGSLIGDIMTEEEQHHRLLRTMGKWLRAPARRKRAVAPAATRAEILRLTEKLRHHEEETIDACAELQQELGGMGDDLILALLDAMVLDSEKHRRLLVVVEKMLKI